MSSFYYPSLLKEVYFNRFKCLQRIALNNIIQNNILIHPLTLSCSHLPNLQNEFELNVCDGYDTRVTAQAFESLSSLSKLLPNRWFRLSPLNQEVMSSNSSVFFYIMFVFYGFFVFAQKDN